jgi:tRNA threonylcarbamoyladenosine biosynthesis protein TsaB
MLRALAVETSSRIGSVATVRDGTVLAEEQFPHGLQHAAHVIPIIDRLCRRESWKPAEIDEIYLSIGPGSFTGLRIGVTVAKTMALANGVKLVAVPTLRVLAENAPSDARHVIIVLDAKRNQIFTARYDRLSPSPGTPGEGKAVAAGDRAGEGWRECEPAHLDSLAVILSRSPRPVHLLGEGIPYHQNFIAKDDPAIIITPSELWRPRASVVAKLGYPMARVGAFADPDRLAPAYIRPPEAQEKWQESHSNDSLNQ